MEILQQINEAGSSPTNVLGFLLAAIVAFIFWTQRLRKDWVDSKTSILKSEAEHDVVELLREQLKELAQSNKELRAEINELREANEALMLENRTLREEVAKLARIIERLNLSNTEG